MVTREALRVLHQKLTFVGSINRGYDSSFAQEGAKIGTDLKIRLPNQYVVTDGAALTTQDTSESSVTLQVTSQKHVGMNFTSAELTLSLDDFSKRIIEPAMSVLAASVEADALSMRNDVYQQANNTAAAITFANVLSGRRKLNDSLAPANDRTALLNSNDGAMLVDALKGLFQDSGQISSQYREGHMGYAAGFNFAETSHLNTQTRGAGDANYVVNTSTGITSGSGTIAVTGGTGAIKKGEVITIVGVDAVHPETKADTGVLQQFVLTADYTGGAGNITVSPVPVTSGATQNVVINSAGASKAVVIAGTVSTNYGQSLVYQKDAFTFATADLVMPAGIDFGARDVYDGISLRVVRDYDINNDRLPCRVDILYGYKTLRAQLACRLANLAG